MNPKSAPSASKKKKKAPAKKAASPVAPAPARVYPEEIDSLLIDSERPEFQSVRTLSGYRVPLLFIRWQPGIYSMKAIRFYGQTPVEPDPDLFDVNVGCTPYCTDPRLPDTLTLTARDTLIQVVSKFADTGAYEYWLYFPDGAAVQVYSQGRCRPTGYVPTGGIRVDRYQPGNLHS